MAIVIDNVQDEAIVSHKLLFVRGSINELAKDEFIVVCNGEPVDFLLHEFRFQFFVELKLGTNIIQFSPMDKSLNIFYRPQTCKRFVRVLLIVLADETEEFMQKYVNNLLTKVSLAARLCQCFVAEELKTKFGMRKTFRFEFDDEKIVCKLFRSKFNENDLIHLNNEEIYWKFAKEIMKNHSHRGLAKYLVVLGCTKYCSLVPSKVWEDTLSSTKFYINYSVGDVAIVHGGGLYAWPSRYEEILSQFLNNKIVEQTKFLNDSAGRDTIGGVYATTFGTIVHEIGHVFNLAHTTNGIMGRGFDNIQLAFLGDFRRETLAVQNESRYNRRHFANNSGEEEIFYHFNDSSLLILNNHQWFNDNHLEFNQNVLNISKHVVQSEFGLILAELRTKDGETVIAMDLNLYKPKSWLIPNEFKHQTDNFLLFVMDVNGIAKSSSLN